MCCCGWIWAMMLLICADFAFAKILPFLPILDTRKPLSPRGQCSVELWNLERELRQTVHPFRVRGHWVSSHCEVRPGPTFLLRDYQFYETGSFQLRQYFYEDSDCTKPKMSFVAQGRLKHLNRSWLVPGGSEASWELSQVSVTPYTKASGREITGKLRANCRPEPHKEFPWPDLDPYRQLLIYKRYYHPEELTLDTGKFHLSEIGETDEIDCTHALNFTLSELELLRMEEKQLSDTNFFVKEFYLGLPVWDPTAKAMRLPAQFQEPLRNAAEIIDCKTCEKVQGSNQLSPPLLRNSKPDFRPESRHFPIDSLDGNWLSTKCESHANGVYVHRQLTYIAHAFCWELRQRHFNDPLCRHPSYTFTAEGEFTILGESPQLRDTWRIVYSVTRALLEPESRRTARNLRHATNCGPSDVWHKGKPIDITEYGGCLALGIEVPSNTKDILRLRSSVAENGDSKLRLFTGDYLGFDASQVEPTSFRTPMEKCDEMTVVVSLFAEDSVDGRERYLMWKSGSSTIASLSELNLLRLCICIFSLSKLL